MLGTRGDEVRKHDRRLRAVVAVFGQAALQFTDIRAQLRDLLALLSDLLLLLGDESLERGDALVGGHASMLYPLRSLPDQLRRALGSSK